MSVDGTGELKEAAVAYQAAVQFPALNDPRHPERIILFGSYAYGQPDEHSDFDLLIIRRNIISEKASNMEIAGAFWDVPGQRPSFTILSKTPERIADRLAVKSSFYEEI